MKQDFELFRFFIKEGLKKRMFSAILMKFKRIVTVRQAKPELTLSVFQTRIGVDSRFFYYEMGL